MSAIMPVQTRRPRLKLDLHTHCFHTCNAAIPLLDTVAKVVAQIKRLGLDGIAVTEHDERDYGFKAREIVEHEFNSEVLIIPGQEIHVGYQHVVELYLPNGCEFRFWAHPVVAPGITEDFIERELHNIHGIEIRSGIWLLDTGRLKEIGQRYGLFLLENSDAHSIGDIGLLYTEIDLDHLCNQARARKRELS